MLDIGNAGGQGRAARKAQHLSEKTLAGKQDMTIHVNECGKHTTAYRLRPLQTRFDVKGGAANHLLLESNIVARKNAKPTVLRQHTIDDLDVTKLDEELSTGTLGCRLRDAAPSVLGSAA